MRRFESLVMSPTEPDTNGTLWLKEKKYIMDESDNNDSFTGLSVWYFGETGWKPLVDFDTRVNFNTSYNTSSINSPVKTNVSYDESGTVDASFTYYLYNGDRALSKNSNLVVEAGLKKHVDDLQSQLDLLKNRVSALEKNVSAISKQIENNTTFINSLNSRVSELESMS